MSETRTITFQPEPDVRKFLNLRVRGSKNKRGIKTKIINEAIRLAAAANKESK